jgi:hypothetical protein
VTTLTGSGHPRIEARLGHLGGFDVTTATCRILGTTQVTLTLDGIPESEIRLAAADLADTDPAGLIIRLENRLTGLESLKTKTVAEIDRLRIEAARAREDIEKPFPPSGQLAEARDRVRRIEEQLKEAAAAQQQDDYGPAVAATGVRDAPGRLTPAGDAGRRRQFQDGHGEQWSALDATCYRPSSPRKRPRAQRDRRRSAASSGDDHPTRPSGEQPASRAGRHGHGRRVAVSRSC